MMLTVRRSAHAVLAALILLAPTALAAQSLTPGTRIRVKSSQVVTPIVGTYQGLRRDTVVVIEDGTVGKLWSFTTPTIDRIEVSEGMKAGNRGPMGRWALIGAGGGAVLGALTAAILESSTDDDYNTFLSAAVGAGLGGAAGAAYGYRILEERWSSVPIPRRVGFAPARDGFRLSFSAAF